jgi:hypothetical protein
VPLETVVRRAAFFDGSLFTSGPKARVVLSRAAGIEGRLVAAGDTSTVRARLCDRLFAEDNPTLKTAGAAFIFSLMYKMNTANPHIKAHKARMPEPASSVLLAAELTRMTKNLVRSSFRTELPPAGTFLLAGQAGGA